MNLDELNNLVEELENSEILLSDSPEGSDSNASQDSADDDGSSASQDSESDNESQEASGDAAVEE